MSAALPNAADVSGALEAICTTPEFARAPVMRHLLRYLVDETLAGRGDRLKAYSVAVDALGRSADFDAQADSYPRVQVGRLRRMLDAYYAGGPGHPLRLSIPLGAYRVEFGSANEADDGAQAEVQPAPSGRPRQIGYLPWIALTAAIVAILAAGLLWIWGFPVADRAVAPQMVTAPPTVAIETGDNGRTPLDRSRIGEIARLFGTAFTGSGIADVAIGGAAVDARYALLLDLGPDGMELSMRLVDREPGRMLWAETIALPEDGATTETALHRTISALVRPSGVIAAHQRGELRTDFSPGYPCLLHYSRYFRERDPAQRARVRACVERTLALDPGHAEALAAASFLAIDPDGKPTDPRALGRAIALAQRAKAAGPMSAAATLAEARVSFIGGNCVRGSALAERAVALQPHDPEVLGLTGMMLVRCDPPRAEALLRDAHDLDPDLTTIYAAALVLLELEGGRNAAAVAIARSMHPPATGMRSYYLIAQTLGHIAAGEPNEARARWRALVAITPPPKDDIDAILRHSFLAPDYRNKLAARIAASGVADAPTASPLR